MSAVIQFSGGKDSLALCYHLQAIRDMVDVVMVDTGDMPDAAYRNLELVADLGYTIIVLKPPRDVPDIDGSNWTECCYRNIWGPMSDYVNGKYRQVFRGSKRCDPHFHGVFPGDIVSNVLYTMPLWDWSDDDVKEYLGVRLPKEYELAEGMPDCLSCPVTESCGGRTRHLWREA